MTEELNQQPREAFAAAIAARMLVKVAEFNREVVALPIPETPQVLGEQRRTWANAALQEELKEFNDAADAGDVLEAADALIDLVYFALGRLVEMGVPATAVWLDITPQLALQRNLELPPEKRLPESTVRHAFALYQQPSTDEGFAAVQIVPADADLNAA